MTVHVLVSQLDAYLKFLADETAYVRKHFPGAIWADAKARKMEGIAEVLRQVRQDKQMTTVGGKRIEG